MTVGFKILEYRVMAILTQYQKQFLSSSQYATRVKREAKGR